MKFTCVLIVTVGTLKGFVVPAPAAITPSREALGQSKLVQAFLLHSTVCVVPVVVQGWRAEFVLLTKLEPHQLTRLLVRYILLNQYSGQQLESIPRACQDSLRVLQVDSALTPALMPA